MKCKQYILNLETCIRYHERDVVGYNRLIIIKKWTRELIILNFLNYMIKYDYLKQCHIILDNIAKCSENATLKIDFSQKYIEPNKDISKYEKKIRHIYKD